MQDSLDPRRARWFSIRVDQDTPGLGKLATKLPASRVIATLELLAVLLAVIIFDIKAPSLGERLQGYMKASTDNG